MSDVLTRTRRVVAAVFGVPEESVTTESSRDDVPGWDSVNALHLMMALESEFAVTIGPEDVADLLSVALIVEVLREKGVR